MTPAGVDPPPSTTGWSRFDPRMLLVQPVDAVKQFLPVILVVLFAGARADPGEWAVNLGVVVLPVVVGVWSWFVSEWCITSEQVMVRSGLLQRTTHTARLDRVRTVDVTASLLQRALGVASVKVGTGSDTPLTLAGLSTNDARTLQHRLLHVARDRGSSPAESVGVAEETVLARFSPSWILLAPFTATGWVAIAAVLGAVAPLGADVLDPIAGSAVGRRVADHVARLTVTAMIVQGTILLVLVLLVASLCTYVLRYWGYRLTRHRRGTVSVSAGLLTSRLTTIEERRLRGVRIAAPLLLRLVGGRRAEALVTGLVDSSEGISSSADMLTPPAPRATVLRVAADVLGDATVLDVPLRAHGPGARRRRITRAVAVATLVAVPAVVAIRWFHQPTWFEVAPVALLLVSPILGEARYRALGHAVTDRHLVAREGLFPQATTVVLGSAVIGWTLRQTWFQRRLALVSLVATIAAGDDEVVVTDISEAEAEAVARAVTPGLPEPFMTRPRHDL